MADREEMDPAMITVLPVVLAEMQATLAADVVDIVMMIATALAPVLVANADSAVVLHLAHANMLVNIDVLVPTLVTVNVREPVLQLVALFVLPSPISILMIWL